MTDNLLPFDRELIDRFVDGELADAEERELLARLDDEPGGWRALALGFVEARTLRRELGGLLREPTNVVSPTAPPHRSRSRHWWQPVAAAVLLLVGYGLGTLLPSFRTEPAADQVVEDRAGEVTVPDSQPEPVPDVEPLPESVVLLVSDDDGVRPVNVPLVRDTSFVSTEPPVPVEDVFAKLRQDVIDSGHAIDERQTMYRLPLDDEHDVWLPVREVEIAPRTEDWVQ